MVGKVCWNDHELKVEEWFIGRRHLVVSTKLPLLSNHEKLWSIFDQKRSGARHTGWAVVRTQLIQEASSICTCIFCLGIIGHGWAKKGKAVPPPPPPPPPHHMQAYRGDMKSERRHDEAAAWRRPQRRRRHSGKVTVVGRPKWRLTHALFLLLSWCAFSSHTIEEIVVKKAMLS